MNLFHSVETFHTIWCICVSIKISKFLPPHVQPPWWSIPSSKWVKSSPGTGLELLSRKCFAPGQADTCRWAVCKTVGSSRRTPAPTLLSSKLAAAPQTPGTLLKGAAAAEKDNLENFFGPSPSQLMSPPDHPLPYSRSSRRSLRIQVKSGASRLEECLTWRTAADPLKLLLQSLPCSDSLSSVLPKSLHSSRLPTNLSFSVFFSQYIPTMLGKSFSKTRARGNLCLQTWLFFFLYQVRLTSGSLSCGMLIDCFVELWPAGV